MKKGIIVLLIAVLASSFAFATFSGSAGVIYNASFDDKSVGADNVNSLSFSFTFASEEIKLDSSEDAIHVEVAASAKFILGEFNPDVSVIDENGIFVSATDLADRGI